MTRPNIPNGNWNIIMNGPMETQHGDPMRSIQTSNGAFDVVSPPCMAMEHEALSIAISALPDLLEALEDSYRALIDAKWAATSKHERASISKKADAAKSALLKAGYTF